VAARVEGAAFPIAVKLLSSALVAFMLYWGLQAREQLAGARWQTSAALLVAAALALVLWCLSWIWRSRSWVDADGVGQSWLWNKRVLWRDVASARLVGSPALAWLMAPRLLVRARGSAGVMVFHCADRQVMDACAAFMVLGRPATAGPV
jgi:hypothetical protein